MNIDSNHTPKIGAGLESVIALTFAGGMFALAILRPAFGLWLPL